MHTHKIFSFIAYTYSSDSGWFDRDLNAATLTGYWLGEGGVALIAFVWVTCQQTLCFTQNESKTNGKTRWCMCVCVSVCVLCVQNVWKTKYKYTTLTKMAQRKNKYNTIVDKNQCELFFYFWEKKTSTATFIQLIKLMQCIAHGYFTYAHNKHDGLYT